MLTVTSADGTTIACDRIGSGPALIIVGGALADHHFYTPLAGLLAQRFTVYTLDRRGRGASGDTLPYAVAREVEDLAAVIDAAGGAVSVYGHSAGSALALRAASEGLSIHRLVLADPPFSAPDGDPAPARAEHAAQQRHVEQLTAAGDHRGSVTFFLSDYGLPDEVVEEILGSPAGSSMIAAARALPYDYAVLGDGVVPLELAGRIQTPTLVVADENASSVARALAGSIPGASLALTRASTHELSPNEVTAVVEPFLVT